LWQAKREVYHVAISSALPADCNHRRVLGLIGVAWLSADIARILFFVFLVLFILSLVGSLSRGGPRDVI
jgi:uncharacterized membrane protein YtjA (UPF0391 family)